MRPQQSFRRYLITGARLRYQPLYPLAHLGLARAAALTGDMSKSRKAYQDLLALWKSADSDLPVLLEAKQEYEELK